MIINFYCRQRYSSLFSKAHIFFLTVNLLIVLCGTLLAVKKTDTEDPYQKGVMYRKENKYKEAIECFQPLAEKRDPKAQHNLAYCHYELGNKQEAYYWYKRASDQGFQSSARNLSKMDLSKLNLFYLLLPDEIISHVASFLSLKDFARFARVSKRANQIFISEMTKTKSSNTFLLSTSSMAMPQSKDKLVSNVNQISLKCPVPPTVTLDDYLNNLCVGGKIDRWEDPGGNLASWLQSPANKNKITDADGEVLMDLPLFQVTLMPKVKGDKICCDYDLPTADSDLSKGSATFFLSCKATPEEIEEVKKLKEEPLTKYTTRLLQWQEMLRKRQQFSKYVKSRILNTKFIPILHKTNNHETNKTLIYSTSLESARKEANFFYLSFDSSTMQTKTFSAKTVKGYEPPIEELKQGTTYNLEQGLDGLRGHTSYLFSNRGGISMSVTSFCFDNFLFETRGDLKIRASKLRLGQNSYFWPVGYLAFHFPDQNYPIDKIKIIPCNSTKPIQVDGSIDLQASPQIDLEFINAAKITVKLKPHHSFAVQPLNHVSPLHSQATTSASSKEVTSEQDHSKKLSSLTTYSRNSENMNETTPSLPAIAEIPKELAKVIDNLRTGKAGFWALPELIKEKEAYRKEVYLPLYLQVLADKRIHKFTKQGLVKNYPHPELICAYLLDEETCIHIDKDLLKKLVVEKTFMKEKGLAFFQSLIKKKLAHFEFKKIFKILIKNKSFAVDDMSLLVCEVMKEQKSIYFLQRDLISFVVNLPGYKANVHGIRIADIARPKDPSNKNIIEARFYDEILELLGLKIK